MTILNANIFWDFSLRLYAKPQVAESCLFLQNNYGANVNVLLWCLWLEANNKRLTEERLHEALSLIKNWDEVYVQALRKLRRQMKLDFANNLDEVAAVRNQIKQTELVAEKQEQQWLEVLASNWPAAPHSNLPIASLGGANAVLYLSCLKIPQSIVDEFLIQVSD